MRRKALPVRFRPALLALEDLSLPSVLTVTNLNDSGGGSLRGQIAAASPGDTIVFDSTLHGTIALSSGELAIAKNLTIAGPGTDLLTVDGNQATRVFSVAYGSTVAISGLTVADGKNDTGLFGSQSGGGLYNDGTLTLTDCVFDNNTAFAGSGLENQGTLDVEGCTFQAGFGATYGGGIYNEGTMTVAFSGFFGDAGFVGGGIDNRNRATVEGCTFAGNFAQIGGGLSNEGTLAVDACTFTRNTTSLTGGGLTNIQTLTLTASTFTGNATDGSGGGVANYNGGTSDMVNCTLTGNTAANGGGFYNLTRSVTATNCTIAGNRATASGSSPAGGGISTDSTYQGTVTLKNTIVAGNMHGTASDDVAGPVVSTSDHNLIGVGTGLSGISAGSNGNQIGTVGSPIDPRLGPLQDNGGPTWTMALLPGSPALNAGTADGAPTTDQRGVPRTGGVSIGAYQDGVIAGQATYFDVTLSPTIVAGSSYNVTITARDAFGNVATGYRGIVYMDSTDPQNRTTYAVPFTAATAGSYTFVGVHQLYSAPQQLIYAHDGTITGSALVTVAPAAPTQLFLVIPDSAWSGLPAGSPLQVTTYLYDAYGNRATNFTGTLHFSSDDPAANLPRDYTFTPGDQGSHTFTVTLNTPGVVNLTVTDTADSVSSSLQLYVF